MAPFYQASALGRCNINSQTKSVCCSQDCERLVLPFNETLENNYVPLALSPLPLLQGSLPSYACLKGMVEWHQYYTYCLILNTLVYLKIEFDCFTSFIPPQCPMRQRQRCCENLRSLTSWISCLHITSTFCSMKPSCGVVPHWLVQPDNLCMYVEFSTGEY